MIRPHRGRIPRIHASAFIDDSAQVIGEVEIGEESSVWMCVAVRGDVNWIRIGRRTNIQDGAVIHGMLRTHSVSIGNEVTVGHGSILHGCAIEDRCLIGMGTILLNGSHVGTESIVAAGTLLVEGMQVPPRSLVMGSPGKVKRTLTDDEVTSILAYADRYVGYRLDYMDGATRRADT
jgi:carbonic anhydrase/acetyltransferase-like protein (isoleucine patch superfamily)